MGRRSLSDEALIAALENEREGYARYGRADRVAMVDVELEKLGVEKKSPPKPASSRSRRSAS
jgi:hypothetical protein